MKTGSTRVIDGVSDNRRIHKLHSLWFDGLIASAVLLFLIASAGPAYSRPAATPQASKGPLTQSVKCLIGLENIKPDTRGTLSVRPDGLQFVNGTEKVDISNNSIQDIFTGQESRQDVSGMGGALAKAAIPYEGGRVVSLFSHKVEILTVEYTDAGGGFHGAIFVLGAGKATAFKNQLVAQGAKVTKHIEAPEPKEEKP